MPCAAPRRTTSQSQGMRSYVSNVGTTYHFPTAELGTMPPSLIENDSKPLYEQVETVIRQRLLDNVYKPGVALPSEHQLAAELGVSQGTVRKALNDLVADKLLFRRQGLGTFVSEHTERRLLYVYFNVVRDDGVRAIPRNQTLRLAQGIANRKEAEKLAIVPGSQVYRLKRLRFLEGDPVMIDEITVSKSAFPGFGGEPGGPPDFLYRYYQSKYGITVAKAREEVKAIAASAEHAKLLGIAEKSPILFVDRVSVTIEMQPVEWRRTICNTATLHLVMERG
jgi:GntR family transcriptional regulator